MAILPCCTVSASPGPKLVALAPVEAPRAGLLGLVAGLLVGVTVCLLVYLDLQHLKRSLRRFRSNVAWALRSLRAKSTCVNPSGP